MFKFRENVWEYRKGSHYCNTMKLILTNKIKINVFLCQTQNPSNHYNSLALVARLTIHDISGKKTFDQICKNSSQIVLH